MDPLSATAIRHLKFLKLIFLTAGALGRHFLYFYEKFVKIGNTVVPILQFFLHFSSEYDTIQYDTRCYFNVCSKADISQLNLPHGTDN